MGGSKLSYIVHYRAKKKEAAEEEKRRRTEDAQRRPEIIDPSFELFGQKTPPSEQIYDDPFSRDTVTTPPALTNDDWLFQTRRVSTLPRNYQFEPYCEVTPKSSVSSQNSAASDAPSLTDQRMGWDVATTARPRPQSYLPSSASASYSLSMTDLHRSTEYKSRRQSSHISGQLHDGLPAYTPSQRSQPSYKLEASLSRPFSIDEPLDFLSEPLQDDQLDTRLPSIPEDGNSNVPDYRGDLIKRGYSA
ncbi:hypothetical protein OHC33_002131 [Knufia fluminis]|uniref:Uncharacterized protein n=1 Tax=Knufia fluminis TaxID=191047 RepID=A0AAN8IB83_9EURO|nr:hypothetical protein OHC33_002131 [Knufia fluminis]